MPSGIPRLRRRSLLRRQLGFSGLVVTDALVMEAIAARHGAEDAAVLAFEAGADLILMPADADAAIDGLQAAFASGRLPLQRLEQALERRRHALARRVVPRARVQQPGRLEISLERTALAVVENGVRVRHL